MERVQLFARGIHRRVEAKREAEGIDRLRDALLGVKDRPEFKRSAAEVRVNLKGAKLPFGCFVQLVRRCCRNTSRMRRRGMARLDPQDLLEGSNRPSMVSSSLSNPSKLEELSCLVGLQGTRSGQVVLRSFEIPIIRLNESKETVRFTLPWVVIEYLRGSATRKVELPQAKPSTREGQPSTV